MVWVWVGKEFPDLRQNEREIKFIRVRDGIRTVGLLQGRTDIEQGSLVHFDTQGTRSGIGVFCRSFTDWKRHVYWGKVGEVGRVRQIPSLYGVGGETGYTAQEDLKSINCYNTGEGRMIGSGFSVPAFQDPPWFYQLFHPALYF